MKLMLQLTVTVVGAARRRRLAVDALGYCGTTISGETESCVVGNSGNWLLHNDDLISLQRVRHACVARCAQCSRCAFVSYSLRWHDCSWFASCGRLHNEVHGFFTATAPQGNLSASLSQPGNGLSPVRAQELHPGTVQLGSGDRMPRLGFGTQGTSTGVLSAALGMGYRLLDTAVAYRNEEIIRTVLAASDGGPPPFLVSKAWPFARVTRNRAISDVSGDALAIQIRRHVAALGV